MDVDEHAAWTFPELILAAETRLGAAEEHMNRLFEAGLNMTSAL